MKVTGPTDVLTATYVSGPPTNILNQTYTPQPLKSFSQWVASQQTGYIGHLSSAVLVLLIQYAALSVPQADVKSTGFEAGRQTTDNCAYNTISPGCHTSIPTYPAAVWIMDVAISHKDQTCHAWVHTRTVKHDTERREQADLPTFRPGVNIPITDYQYLFRLFSSGDKIIVYWLSGRDTRRGWTAYPVCSQLTFQFPGSLCVWTWTASRLRWIWLHLPVLTG